MNTADKITASRIILAPVFFVVYSFPAFFPALPAGWTVPTLWALFIIIELTDMFDGMVARKQQKVSDFGKLFDPFADTLVWITFFLAFVSGGLLPVIVFLGILYREFSIAFLRNLLLKRGVTQGARKGGKIKAIAYLITGGLSLLAVSVQRLGLDETLFRRFRLWGTIVFIIAMAISFLSFFDYLAVYRRTRLPTKA
jgi:CDP-diacylglycerol--glycerol-3-phosphate 3-phosphatidyltransferase